VDKVFYSPLFGLPPPFFKYAKHFDQTEIVCKFHEEFENLDSHDNGFVPTNIFKNVLEGELNVKTKIVENFINSLRDVDLENSNPKSSTKLVQEVQSLDVNLITNSLKTSHIDYIVLLRKLAQFMEQNCGQTNIGQLTNDRILEQAQQIEEAQEVTISFEIDNGMCLKNPLAGNEPPNAFVHMKPTFQYKENGAFVRTSHVKSSAYPNWNHKSYNFTMPVNACNQDFLNSGKTLEFEVFHRAVGAGDAKETAHLVGVAFVPLQPLVDGNGRTRFTGLYDVVPKGAVFQSVHSNASTQLYGGMKIKVTVNCSVNIKKMLPSVALPEEVQEQPAVVDHAAILAQELKVATEGPMSIDDMKVLQQKITQIKDSIDELNFSGSLKVTTTEHVEAKAEGEGVRSPGFGHATFKTDVQRDQLTTEIHEFRQAVQTSAANPFHSTDTLGVAQTAEADADDDLTRHEEPPAGKAEESKTTEPALVKEHTSPLRRSAEKIEKEVEVENVFAKDEPKNANDETVFDLEEMKRIEKILKNNN
jgi:hypothetical protein